MRFIGFIFAISLSAATVSTAQYDNARTGANTSETLLTQANVAGAFGKLGSYAIDGLPWAQPLFIPNITVSGTAYNLLIVATSTNKVYAFNAGKPGTAALWSLDLGTSYTNTDTNQYDRKSGITGTPVVDTGSGVLYFVSCNSSGAYAINAVNLADGSTFHSPTTISGTVSAKTFVATSHMQRPALLLAGTNVYVSFGSYGDVGTWYGWIFAYSKTTLAQTQSFITVPSSVRGALWMAGGGPSSDGTNIWFITGNDAGTCTPPNYPESFVSVDLTLAIADYMTAANCLSLDGADGDLGSGRAMLIGNYIVGGGKDGRIWFLNKGAMGSNQGSGPSIAQVFQATVTDMYSLFDSYVFGNGKLFVGGRADFIYAYSCPTTCTTTPANTSASTFGNVMLAYSSNGAATGTGILWATTAQQSAYTDAVAGVFCAYNADTLGNPLYCDNNLGTYAKFTMPTVANGHVYVPTMSGSINVYGLLPAFLSGQTVLQGNAVLTSQ